MLRRVKRRYLAVEIDPFQVFDAESLLNAVWDAVARMYGEYGASHSGLALIDYDKERGLAVIRVNLTALDQVRASLAALTRICGKPATLHVFAVSGTLKALRRRLH